MLAGLTKGPSYFSPDRHPARARERLAYVLSRLHEHGMAGTARPARGLPALPAMVAYEPRRDIGFHFVDQVAREAKAVAGIDAINATSYVVRSTIDPHLQRAVEEALQEGLWRYERNAGRAQFHRAEASLARPVRRIEADARSGDGRPPWQQALASARLPLYDVHWTRAIVVARPTGRRGETWRGETWRVGLADGHPPAVDRACSRRAEARAQRCRVCPRHGGRRQVRSARRVAHTPGGAGDGGGAGEQHRSHPR